MPWGRLRNLQIATTQAIEVKIAIDERPRASGRFTPPILGNDAGVDSVGGNSVGLIGLVGTNGVVVLCSGIVNGDL